MASLKEVIQKGIDTVRGIGKPQKKEEKPEHTIIELDEADMKAIEEIGPKYFLHPHDN